MKEGLCPDMPWYVDNWIGSGKRKSLADYEQNGYFLLLCHSWSDPDCCLPDDDIVLARLSELGKKWIKSANLIRKCFEPDPNRPGFIFNARLRLERQKQNDRINGAHEKAKRAAEARWRKPKPDAQALPKHMHEHPPSNAQASFKHMLGDASELGTRNSDTQVKSTETPSPCPPVAEKAHEIAAYWNTKGNLPKVQTINPKRSKSLTARLKDPFFRENWKAAIDKVAVLPFCNAKIPTQSHPNGWQADFDWFISTSAVTRVIEGKYDRNTPKPGAETEHDTPFRTNKP